MINLVASDRTFSSDKYITNVGTFGEHLACFSFVLLLIFFGAVVTGTHIDDDDYNKNAVDL